MKITNYRSFKTSQTFEFPPISYSKPISIIGYNNSGKTTMMNAILYGIGEKYLNEKTFSIQDLHNLDLDNQIEIKTRITASNYGENSFGVKTIAGDYTISTELLDYEIKSTINKSFFGANKHYNIFYLNFHNIKDEISIKKSSWGSLTSFLAKHIRKLVDSDPLINERKQTYLDTVNEAREHVLADTALSQFVEKIKENYSNNLRRNDCEIEYGTPEYDDIFLQMIFKVGLNGNIENLLPLSHLGDGYISMFVMAVIQAIAESNVDDKCLFLFEEPESFLHENHQEYFYKMVLCQLAENGHQVIYTTHSDKMIDIFDTKSIIRLEFDEVEKYSVNKYNIITDFNPETDNIISIQNFNSFIKSVEPNINKILFSRKILLVEGPNDLLSYNYAIEKFVQNISGNDKYAKAYLNFKNISIAVHHGKATAFIIAELCKHFSLDYYMINDWDLNENHLNDLSQIESEEELKDSNIYLLREGVPRNPTERGILTTNWKLINKSSPNQLHFNFPKLETVLGYDSDDKDSLRIWQRLNEIEEFEDNFFPLSLREFLEFDDIPQT
ncbi:ATP-dependent nuclease [Sphingobacterium spiritivorum]|uniref:ATP-dependent nuclease n=1 Tax=Sphingobacterium spiritivorum TaxID=258 RepID=UPI001F249156|nr:AAA family ATPase [Sphingobacterium spiritivorum]